MKQSKVLFNLSKITAAASEKWSVKVAKLGLHGFLGDAMTFRIDYTCISQGAKASTALPNIDGLFSDAAAVIFGNVNETKF